MIPVFIDILHHNMSNIWGFLETFSLLTFNFFPFWLKNIFCMTRIIIKSLRVVLWPRWWLILINIPCALEMIVHSTIVDWIAVYICTSWVKLLDYVVHILSIVFGFLCLFYINYSKMGNKICESRFVYFSIQFIPFLLHIFY